MDKNFNSWNEIKKTLESNKFIHTKTAEIYNAKLGENVGFEQSGKRSEFLRPIVVFKKFSKTTILAIPLSTTDKRGKYYFQANILTKKNCKAHMSHANFVQKELLCRQHPTIVLYNTF